MRICIVNEFFYPDSTGGTGTVLSSLTHTLRQRYKDVEIHVCTSRHLYRQEQALLPPYQEWEGVRIHRVRSPQASRKSTIHRLTANLLFSIAVLLHLLRSGGYDLLLIGTAPPTLALIAALYRRLTGTPYNYVIYDLEPDRAVAMKVIASGGLPARLLWRCQRAWLHQAARVIVLGRCMRDHISSCYGLSIEKIAVIPIGADPLAVAPQSKITRFRRRHGLSGFIALYSGNFGRYHNFDTILDAARRLGQTRQDISFVLVGGGAQKEHIATRIAAEGLSNVRMFDFVPEAEYADLLASADVSLVTLEPGMEGICVPSKFYSILASGRATIALMSPLCEVAQVIAESRCGIVLDQQDSSSLARALCRLADCPEEVTAMGCRARTTLLSNYTSEHVADAYYQTFQLSALQGRDRKPCTDARCRHRLES